MCWGDPIDCARAARGEPTVSRYTQEHVDALIAAAVEAEREVIVGYLKGKNGMFISREYAVEFIRARSKESP